MSRKYQTFDFIIITCNKYQFHGTEDFLIQYIVAPSEIPYLVLEPKCSLSPLQEPTTVPFLKSYELIMNLHAVFFNIYLNVILLSTI